MRYTTIIDLTDAPALYRSVSVRLVYLHMCLKAGYHDHDRDVVDISIRRLASETGCTVAATRHALQVLQKYKMIAKIGTAWTVRKWVAEQPVTSRAKTARQQRDTEKAAERKRLNELRERENEIEAIRRENLRAQGKTTFMVWYESMVAKAEAGDAEAAETVKRNRGTYDKQKAAVEVTMEQKVND